VIIKGFIGTTLIDYPGHIATTVFTAGCHFRCPYCYNVDLVLRPGALPTLDNDQVLFDIGNRVGFIDGVVVTGGEPTEQKGLGDFLGSVKAFGLKVKIDTNGHEPTVLHSLVERDVLDFISMDFKGPPDRYAEIVRAPMEWSRIEQSLSLVLKHHHKSEVRTTLHPKLHSRDDLVEMGKVLGPEISWSWQPVYPAPTLDPDFQVEEGEELDQFRTTLLEWSKSFPNVRVSGLPPGM